MTFSENKTKVTIIVLPESTLLTHLYDPSDVDLQRSTKHWLKITALENNTSEVRTIVQSKRIKQRRKKITEN